MASGDGGDHSDPASNLTNGLSSTFKPGDFGLNASDIADLDLGADSDDTFSDDEDDEDDADPIAAERKRRQKRQDVLKRTAGEPLKPQIDELGKLQDGFLGMLRNVLAQG